MRAASTCGVTAVAVVVAAAPVVVGAKTRTDLNVRVPFLPVPKFSWVVFVVVPISQEQASSVIATVAAVDVAAGQADH